MYRVFLLLKSIGSSTKRLLITTFLVVLFYLLQVCVVPYLKVFGAMPNLHMVVIAILTVSCGRKFAFASGALTGILLEAVSRNINSFYVLIYPTLALIFAQLFADMSDLKREIRRIQLRSEEQTEQLKDTTPGGRKRFRIRLRFKRNSADDLNPHLRILLNAVTLHAAYEIIMMIYVSLSGVPIGFYHIAKLVKSCLYTALCCVLMFPARYALGMYKKRAVKEVGDDLEQYSEGFTRADWQSIALIPDNPTADSLHSFELRHDGGVEKLKSNAKDDTLSPEEETVKATEETKKREPQQQEKEETKDES